MVLGPKTAGAARCGGTVSHSVLVGRIGRREVVFPGLVEVQRD